MSLASGQNDVVSRWLNQTLKSHFEHRQIRLTSVIKRFRRGHVTKQNLSHIFTTKSKKQLTTIFNYQGAFTPGNSKKEYENRIKDKENP
jgi:hypothetical protein